MAQSRFEVSMQMAGPCLDIQDGIRHCLVDNLSVLNLICRNLSESPGKVIDEIVSLAIFIAISKF